MTKTIECLIEMKYLRIIEIDIREKNENGRMSGTLLLENTLFLDDRMERRRLQSLVECRDNRFV